MLAAACNRILFVLLRRGEMQCDGKSLSRFVFWWVAASCFVWPWGAPNQHIFLPPAAGATPLSVQIQSEAYYVAAYGDMLESAATARKINADAVAQEIQNSVAYVDAYFKRRELNREWRAKEDPNYLEREKHRQEVLKRRVEEQYQDILKGDVTGPLNWLLRELTASGRSTRPTNAAGRLTCMLFAILSARC